MPIPELLVILLPLFAGFFLLGVYGLIIHADKDND
jgi:hypothetical protein